MTSPSAPPRRRLTDTQFRVAIGLAVAVAFGALYLGIRATNTGDDDPVAVRGRPDVVEALVPGDGDEVIRQAELGIDLAPGYEATLVVNGVEIPAGELRVVDAENQVWFAPGEGKAVESLRAGPNCAEAVVWEASVGRGPSDQTFTWCFEAT